MLSPEYSNSSKIVPKLLKNIIFSFSFLFILNQSFIQIKDLLIFSIVFFFKLHQIPLKVHSNDINPEIPIKIVMLEPEFIMIKFVE